jgi:hypothetical protein
MTRALEEQTKHCEEFLNEQKAGNGARSKPLAMIEKWAVVQNVVSQHFEALKAGNRLRGYVIGRPDLPNTKLVYTSAIISADLALGLIETRNTIYRLGEVSEEYRSWSASARNR